MRRKEGEIIEVIENVLVWRGMYNGVNDMIERIDLNQAATMLGITKKTLDDYML